jgi:hypothetical protein
MVPPKRALPLEVSSWLVLPASSYTIIDKKQYKKAPLLSPSGALYVYVIGCFIDYF